MKHELATAKTGTSRVLLMVKLANAYFVNFPDSLIKYARKALDLATAIQFSKGEAGALNALGLGFQFKGDYPKSLAYLYKGLQIAEEQNYVFDAAISYAWIGNAYEFLGEYSKSIDFCKKSQSLLETILDTQGVNEWIWFNDLNIGQDYLQQSFLDSAYHYLSLYYDVTLKDKFWHPVALYNLGDCLFRQGERVRSLNYVRQGIGGAVPDDYVTRTEAYATMSSFFITLNQPDSAIYFAKKGLETADSMPYGSGIYKNSKMLADQYELSNLAQSVHYHKIHDSIGEVLFGAKKFQELQKTLADEQQRRQQVHEEQIRKEDTLKQYAFIAGLAITLLIAFILYKNNLQKKKSNDLLQRQKEKVESTLQELKSTQAQLIQSEKMASLGEITSGIAHEIQNPLNFINNFAQVNEEYVEEAKVAIKKGNGEEAIDILNNLQNNQKKINQHGQRADSIVKSMLQHSRASSGQKEPTDLNALVDEYLRLGYHGWKARDKSAQITLKKALGPSIKAINVVPQDLGRVILNLCNNAFYAVSEKSKTQSDDYEPTVEVGTVQVDHKVEITIKDNGNGIPAKIKDKIFQPFFTTKSTGQGTGLGLSLAYDIVKAHGGKIEVKSKEKEGSEFSIQLPIS